MWDFDAKLRKKEDEDEPHLGPFGFAERNERDIRLLNYLQEKRLFAINTCFYKNTK